MRIDSAIIEVLAKAEVSGNTLRLTEQLDRKTYQQVSNGAFSNRRQVEQPQEVPRLR